MRLRCTVQVIEEERRPLSVRNRDDFLISRMSTNSFIVLCGSESAELKL